MFTIKLLLDGKVRLQIAPALLVLLNIRLVAAVLRPANHCLTDLLRISVPGRAHMSVPGAPVNKIAPEHLELMVENPATIIGKIKNAGAVFIGYATPTAVGDYWAGPSHVLPTGSTARFSSGLSAATFFKRTSYIQYTLPMLKKQAPSIEKLAAAEGLRHHQDSIAQRSRTKPA